MPKDHKAVFGAVTDYSWVDKDACYENLDLITLTASETRKLWVTV